LLVAGIFMMLGVFIQNIAYTSVVISSMIYLGYGFARVLAMVIDGIPHNNLVAATVLEIIVGIAGILILFRFRSAQNKS